MVPGKDVPPITLDTSSKWKNEFSWGARLSECFLLLKGGTSVCIYKKEFFLQHDSLLTRAEKSTAQMQQQPKSKALIIPNFYPLVPGRVPRCGTRSILFILRTRLAVSIYFHFIDVENKEQGDG